MPVCTERDHIGHARLALGQRGRLVEQDGIYVAYFLQTFRVFIQDPERGRFPRSRHYRDGCRQAESARAGNDEHAYRISHAMVGIETAVYDQPNGKSYQRYRGNGGDENARHLIGKLLNGRLGRAGLSHHFYYLGESRIGAYPLCAHLYHAALVERRRSHGVARAYFDRQTLAGNGRPVYERAAFGDHAVNRDILTLLYHEYVADRDPRYGNFLLPAVDLSHHPVGRELQELLYLAARAAL